jgi:hypothetical protein
MSRACLTLAIAALLMASAGRAAADSAEDRAAAQQIAQDLKDSGMLKGYRVGVKYQDGVAWLTGSVTSVEQKRIAERLASQAKGVDRVISKLEIAGGNVADDGFRQAGGVSENDFAVEPATARPAARPMPVRNAGGGNMPVPYARTMGGPIQQANYGQMGGQMGGPMGGAPGMGGGAPMGAMGQSVSYDNPQMPGYAWPSYASYPNYAALTYPQQYSPSAWPYIGPFYPDPQVPLGWRKVTLEWDDGWWFLDFKDCKDCH